MILAASSDDSGVSYPALFGGDGKDLVGSQVAGRLRRSFLCKAEACFRLKFSVVHFLELPARPKVSPELLRVSNLHASVIALLRGPLQ